MKKTLLSLWVAILLIAVPTSSTFATSAEVNLKNISNDYQILENGDGVFIDITQSAIQNVDTHVTLSFVGSTAEPIVDFKLRYLQGYVDIPISQNNDVVVTIPAGKSKVRIFPYSLLDCVDESEERINMQITGVDNNISLGSNLTDTITIEDNTYDDSYYYVSKLGDDSNDGSCASPVKTLATALYRFRDNDKTSLIIRGGTYKETNNVHVLKSGTSESPITIRAEYPGNVFLVGNRSSLERDGSSDFGLMIQEAKHVLIKDISFINFGTGLKIYDSIKNRTTNITIEGCDFINNGHAGLNIIRGSNVTVKNSGFWGMIPVSNSVDSYGNQCDGLCAIQDYGVGVYLSDNTTIIDNLFYGRHHQALSFKVGNNNGLAERNIFVGALYTAIYLGQNYINDAEPSRNLTARFNIVLDEENFPVKSPIRIDNVINATVENNYFEDFDYSNNLAGILILKRATGNINISNNILAFGQNNNNSGAFEIDDDDGCPSDLANITINTNLVYKVHHGLTDNNCSDRANYSDNTLYKLLDDPYGETLVNPGFVVDPLELDIPLERDFDRIYHQLVQPFSL